MHLPDSKPHPQTDISETEDNPFTEGAAKPADFMVDSAGNVSPRTRLKAEALAARTAPPSGRWSRSG